jgi:CDP-glycerol glycerophosphotransferase (TagB/SpsB family)
MEYPSKRIVYLGFPIHDVLNSRNNEIAKITKEHFDKIIIWMPTFRKKGGEIKRIDSDEEQPLGIPLLSRMEEYHALNAFLKKKNALLILKIHPMQDLSDLKIYDLSNICVLTGNRVKELGVDTYKLMSCSDAMISDYSGAAFDYLQVNKPIAYVLSDKDSYRLGFVLDDISRLLAGPAIYSINDMYAFISDVMEGTDQYQERRKEVKEFIFEYNDTNNCERLAKFLGLL